MLNINYYGMMCDAVYTHAANKNRPLRPAALAILSRSPAARSTGNAIEVSRKLRDTNRARTHQAS